jgi:rod shape-determining protein MreC
MALRTADSDQRAIRDTSPGLRLFVLCIFSIGIMALDNQNQHLQSIRRILSATTYPIRLIVDAPFSFGHWISDTMGTRTTLITDNDALNRKILIQNARLQRMAALEAENARLRILLDSTANVGNRVLVAEIMSVDMNPFRHMIVVNRGSVDGVEVGQALIDGEGIIGQIVRDNIFSSEAILITDIDHALPVEFVRNRLRTITVGTGDLERLSLPFLPRNADVQSGDLLVTSGLGGTFPAGYPVGVVREVTSEVGQPFLKITAEPAAALNRIREVLLIRTQAPEAVLAALNKEIAGNHNDAAGTAEEPAPLEPASVDAGGQTEAATAGSPDEVEN